MAAAAATNVTTQDKKRGTEKFRYAETAFILLMSSIQFKCTLFDCKSSEMNSDAPAVMRRRRRAARQSREKTPEPIARMGGIKPKYSDEENSSTTPNDQTNRLVQPSHRISKHRTASNSSGDGSNKRVTNNNSSSTAYRNKILSRRDRNAAVSLERSHSTPRSVPIDSDLMTNDDHILVTQRRNSSGNVMTFLRQVKRSLSIPRQVQHQLCMVSYGWSVAVCRILCVCLCL